MRTCETWLKQSWHVVVKHTAIAATLVWESCLLATEAVLQWLANLRKPDTGSRTVEQLTPAQREVCDMIVGAYRCRHLLPQLHERCFPLIVGPSGAGKTTTVRTAVEQIRALHTQRYPGSTVAYVELNALAWVPQGAQDPTSLRLLFNAMCTIGNSRRGLLILFLDELDKLLNTSSRENNNASWHRSVIQEIQAILGRTADIMMRYRALRLLTWRGPRWINKRAILRHAFLIGAGAFQDVYKTGAGLFNPEERVKDVADHGSLFGSHSECCDFNGDDFQLFSRCQWIMLSPPTLADLRRAAHIMVDGPLRSSLIPHVDGLVNRAALSPTPLRTLESLIITETIRLVGRAETESATRHLVSDGGTSGNSSPYITSVKANRPEQCARLAEPAAVPVDGAVPRTATVIG